MGNYITSPKCKSCKSVMGFVAAVGEEDEAVFFCEACSQRKRIDELEAERDSYRHTANKHALRVAQQAIRIEELEAERDSLKERLLKQQMAHKMPHERVAAEREACIAICTSMKNQYIREGPDDYCDGAAIALSEAVDAIEKRGE